MRRIPRVFRNLYKMFLTCVVLGRHLGGYLHRTFEIREWITHSTREGISGGYGKYFAGYFIYHSINTLIN